MPIHLLDTETINQIAAGEVIDRPSSIVKELLENAIDAGATSVTLEIRDGGISLIRVTDNGSGIPADQIPLAFLRHSTSKIDNARDLGSIHTLGFRGEALSSIAAVSKVELLTKTRETLTGCRYVIEGGAELASEEIGGVDGTTFLVRDLFYNTPARRKFLKTESREAAYVTDLAERLALSRPDIAIKLIVQGREVFYTSGNGRLKDAVYAVLGRDAAKSLLPVSYEGPAATVRGYVGTPDLSRASRALEFYFINGRYIRNNYITDGLEEAYRPYLMQHRYPFAVLDIAIPVELTDVNVHPSKMEIRFQDPLEIRHSVLSAVTMALKEREHIPQAVMPVTKPQTTQESIPVQKSQTTQESSPVQKSLAAQESSPVQKSQATQGNEVPRKAQTAMPDGEPTGKPQPAVPCASAGALGQTEMAAVPAAMSPPADSGAMPVPDMFRHDVSHVAESAPYEIGRKTDAIHGNGSERRTDAIHGNESGNETDTNQRYSRMDMGLAPEPFEEKRKERWRETLPKALDPEQQTFLKEREFQEKNRQNFRLIGQAFGTYWIMEYEDKLYFIDQHAAHEKVIFERLMKSFRESQVPVQMVAPPLVLTLTAPEKEAWAGFREQLAAFGFETEDFGGKDILITGVPATDFHIPEKDLLLSFLKDLAREDDAFSGEEVADRLATMSCKAAIKGNHVFSMEEASSLIDQMLRCENPYNCPHGRPTMIEFTERELEKLFKRIV